MSISFEEFVGHKVVIDTKTPIVYLGTLSTIEGPLLVMDDVDVHDINDTQTTKDMYILESKKSGIKKNRSRVHVCSEQVVSISRLDDIIQY